MKRAKLYEPLKVELESRMRVLKKAVICSAVFLSWSFRLSAQNQMLSVYEGQIASSISEVDQYIRQGVAANQNGTGSPEFDKAQEILDRQWNLAKTVDLRQSNHELFLKLARLYMVFHIRQKQENAITVNEIIHAYGDQIPEDPTVLYLLALAAFREDESNRGTYDDAYKYLNLSMSSGVVLPEALWLRSQVYAMEGNPNACLADQKRLVKMLDRLSPQLYLYDTNMMAMIKKAVLANVGGAE
jgi:hypothetical protein